MRNHQWTITVTAILVSGMLAGCALPGRFSREQYAALDTDPFLSTGSATLADTSDSHVDQVGMDHAEPMHSEVAHADTSQVNPKNMQQEPTLTASADAPGEVAFERDAESEPLVDWGSQPADVADVETTNTSAASEQALANFFGDSAVADVSKQVTTAVAEADRGFNDFLTDQSSKVVRASAEVADVVKTASNNVGQAVHESDVWGFPGDSAASAQPSSQKMEFQPSNPFDSEPADIGPNPFGKKDPLPTVAPPSDLFGKPSQDSAWPPGNFEPN